MGDGADSKLIFRLTDDTDSLGTFDGDAEEARLYIRTDSRYAARTCHTILTFSWY